MEPPPKLSKSPYGLRLIPAIQTMSVGWQPSGAPSLLGSILLVNITATDANGLGLGLYLLMQGFGL